MIETPRISDDVVIKRIAVGADMELHVKVTVVDHRPLVQLRQFYPSSEEYGRGVIIPHELAEDLAEALILAKAAVK